MRNIKFVENEYYHIYGRSSGESLLFLDESDSARFLFLILYFQSPTPFMNLHFYVSKFMKSGSFKISEEKLKTLIKTRQIEILSFSLMNNYFHLLVQNIDDGAVSSYMQRVLMAYSKYYNAKYKKRGHLFEGPFKATHIKNDAELLRASAYIHKNQKDVPPYHSSNKDYLYSSLRDYLDEPRWGELLKSEVILDRFKNKSEYRHFVSTSSANEYIFAT